MEMGEGGGDMTQEGIPVRVGARRDSRTSGKGFSRQRDGAFGAVNSQPFANGGLGVRTPARSITLTLSGFRLGRPQSPFKGEGTKCLASLG